MDIIKYPRTPHLEGSRLQPGDEDLSQIPFSAIRGRHIVIEEKVDGANTAVSFDGAGRLLLQSRGHFLSGGYRERHYDLFKQWAAVHNDEFYSVLGSRYIMYGEWLYAKHKIFYDQLPHYFLEFDILDRTTGKFLDTRSRHELLKDIAVVSVPVLAEGEFHDRQEVIGLLGKSNYISEAHTERLREAAAERGLDAEKVLEQTDASQTMEGVYIKAEENGEVVGRMKFVRASFLQTMEDSDTRWLDRPIVPNLLSGRLEELFAL